MTSSFRPEQLSGPLTEMKEEEEAEQAWGREFKSFSADTLGMQGSLDLRIEMLNRQAQVGAWSSREKLR